MFVLETHAQIRQAAAIMENGKTSAERAQAMVAMLVVAGHDRTARGMLARRLFKAQGWTVKRVEVNKRRTWSFSFGRAPRMSKTGWTVAPNASAA